MRSRQIYVFIFSVLKTWLCIQTEHPGLSILRATGYSRLINDHVAIQPRAQDVCACNLGKRANKWIDLEFKCFKKQIICYLMGNSDVYFMRAGGGGGGG
jgi:hypothetical protein